jgi:hypothetical protein
MLEERKKEKEKELKQQTKNKYEKRKIKNEILFIDFLGFVNDLSMEQITLVSNGPEKNRRISTTKQTTRTKLSLQGSFCFQVSRRVEALLGIIQN